MKFWEDIAMPILCVLSGVFGFLVGAYVFGTAPFQSAQAKTSEKRIAHPTQILAGDRGRYNPSLNIIPIFSSI